MTEPDKVTNLALAMKNAEKGEPLNPDRIRSSMTAWKEAAKSAIDAIEEEMATAKKNYERRQAELREAKEAQQQVVDMCDAGLTGQPKVITQKKKGGEDSEA